VNQPGRLGNNGGVGGVGRPAHGGVGRPGYGAGGVGYGNRYSGYRAGYAHGTRHAYYHNRYNHWEDYWKWRTVAGAITMGVAIASQPRYYSTVYYGDSVYYYSDGVYYTRTGSTYVVVPAPTGAVVQTPPPTYETVVYNNTNYYYANGTYYQETDKPADNLTAEQSKTEAAAAEKAAENPDPAAVADAVEDPDPFEGETPPEGVKEGEQTDEDPAVNFVVVAPPIGATVSVLPEGTVKKEVDGRKYFEYAGTWYKAYYSGDTVIYMVVGEPEGA
jgi:hypothetical protein